MAQSRRSLPLAARSDRGIAAVVAVVLAATAAIVATGPRPVNAASDSGVPSAVTVGARASGQGWTLKDGHGREVTLRGFNVSGSAKLYENGLLPFRSTADAAASAEAMRDLTGANAIRFLINWEGVQPTPYGVDTGYLARAVDQVRQFTDRGFYVLLDYHQDLYSSYLFNRDSWYTGDGAPRWVVEAGGYPRESCGVCIMWGQNMLNNAAVRSAARDFWHNRTIETAAGPIGVQTAFLGQARSALTYVKQALPAEAYDRILGVDPFNEPFDGGTDGAPGTTWEQTHLAPFYQRFRATMDAAGWTTKPLYAEPLVFWNVGFFESGGLSTIDRLGTRYVFNSHYYDGARMTVDPSPARDGAYAAAMNRIRIRATELGTAPIVTEFGNRLSGWGSDRTPWMVRAMYQGMDAGTAGADWWRRPASGGAVLSSMLWQWDVYSDRHHELMNRNPDRVRTADDAWQDEDHSVVYRADSGAVVPRLDRRVLDRLYPAAVAGETLGFAYEDLARSGYGGAGSTRSWLTVPASLPNVAALVGSRQYGVLVWRESAGGPGAPTELHLPASFSPAHTVVVGDVAAHQGLTTTGPIRLAREVGSATANRLVVERAAVGTPRTRVLLVANAADGGTVSPATLEAARAELITWAGTVG